VSSHSLDMVQIRSRSLDQHDNTRPTTIALSDSASVGNQHIHI